MSKIRGITITLYEETQKGVDSFNSPVYEYEAVSVNNVLIGEPSTMDVTNTTALYGRKAQYTLAIPKGDTHDWENVTVEFFGHKWRTFGIPVEGIETMLPLDWNKKVWVERYE